MEKMKIGERIRKLRKEKGMSQERLCEDRRLINVLKLRRIEKGTVSPNLDELEYIAQRLGVRLDDVVLQQELLPQRYLELKNELEKLNVYDDAKREIRMQQLFQEIDHEYYPQLPPEEKKIIDLQKAIIYTHLRGYLCYDKKQLQQDLRGFKTKKSLDKASILAVSLYLNSQKFEEWDELEMEGIIDQLLLQSSHYLGEETEELVRLLIACLGVYEFKGHFIKMEPILPAVRKLMDKMQSYSLKPILEMIEGKCLLFVHGSVKEAEKKYHDAAHLSFLLGDEFLGLRILEEKEKDLSTFRAN